MPQTQAITEAMIESDDPRKPQYNEATVLLYPFREMELGWWDDFLRSFRSDERAIVQVRVMDCLMAHALLHEDPYLEEAVVQMGTKIPKQWSGNISQELIACFEVAHHIFKTICVTAKFPSLDDSKKRTLLKMTEQRNLEIENAAKKPEMRLGKKVSQRIRMVITRVAALRDDLDSRAAFVDLMDSMKELFFSVSTRNGVDPPTGDATWFDTFVCCEGCPCSARLRTGPTLYLRDIEKAKIMDCIMMCAIKLNDAVMRQLTTEMIVNHYKDFLDDPQVDDVSRHVQNGKLFFCRTAIYDALGGAGVLVDIHEDVTQIQKDCTPLLVRTGMFIMWAKGELKDIRKLNELVPYLDRALACIESAYPRVGRPECRQDLATLDDLLTFVFKVLSAPEFHLAVHSRDVFVGKPADMKCANPGCPGTTKDLLKCSGCDVTYYCSSECQKTDWEKHKNFCHEIESRRAKPTPLPFEYGPIRCVKPAV